MRKNLVIVRGGDKSLHPQWLVKDRNWDLALSYYGNHPERYAEQFDMLDCYNGSKWEGLSAFINSNQSLIEMYEYIWMPDDDLLTNGQNINDFFDICKLLDATIAQPALTPYSYYSWDITLQIKHLTARYTNFIEVMAPCFNSKYLHLFSDFFGENSSGWGYEWLWYHIAIKHNISNFFIIDKVPVYHTRPIGSAGHGGSISSPNSEMSILLKKYDIDFFLPAVLREIS
jgi:hypothetical protein